jgi:hypothetical protein
MSFVTQVGGVCLVGGGGERGGSAFGTAGSPGVCLVCVVTTFGLSMRFVTQVGGVCGAVDDK